MYPKTQEEVYADVGRSAASVALRLGRLAKGRETKSDREALCAVAAGLERLAEENFKFDPKDELFPRLEGYVVVSKAAKDWPERPASQPTKKYLHDLSNRIEKVVHGQDIIQEEVQGLRRFFRKIHDLAEEITITGLTENPVVELFKALR